MENMDSTFRYKKADDSAGFLLWKITALWQRKIAEVLGEFGITQTQYALLASLKWFEEKAEDTTQSHLVEFTRIDKMTVSKAIRKLEVATLVLRTQSSSDSRAIVLRLTAYGKNLILKAIVAIEDADEEFFSVLTSKQLELYKSLTVLLISDK